jgi:hypothetical protein
MNTLSRSATSNGAFRKPKSSTSSTCRSWQSRRAFPVFEDHLALMLDLQLLAFQSDLTRVISFMILKEQSARPYPQIGVPEAHHPLSHHGNARTDRAHVEDQPIPHAQLFSAYLAEAARHPTTATARCWIT